MHNRIDEPIARIRPAAVAGSFYPDSRAELQATLARLLAPAQPRNPGTRSGRTAQVSAAQSESTRTPVKALIVPHAGYMYSGELAARAYRAIEGQATSIARVVLLGPCHHVWVAGMALSGHDAFATPLGTVPVDAELRDRIRSAPGMTTAPGAHAPEHSLEVHLPFLQAQLGDFSVLPILVGGAPPEQVAAVLDAVWGGPETLIVVSTDLSHFHPEAEARRRDRRTAEVIEHCGLGLHGDDACGAAPLNGLLQCAHERHLRPERIGLSNSADAGGPAERVVGYGAWLLNQESP